MAVARQYKTVGFSVPPALAERLAAVARERQLTKSELFREIYRVWERVEAEQRRTTAPAGSASAAPAAPPDRRQVSRSGRGPMPAVSRRQRIRRLRRGQSPTAKS